VSKRCSGDQSAGGLGGSRLVKHVTRRSRQAAGSLVPVYGRAGDMFYKRRHGPARLPGEVTRAHRGRLFLDEQPEFRRDRLEVLRQLREKDITALQFPVHTRCHRLSHIGRAREVRSGEAERSPLPSRRGASTPGTSVRQRSRGPPHSESACRIFHSPSTVGLESG
jgi:hypothetical protein